MKFKVVVSIQGSEIWHVEAKNAEEAQDIFWEEAGNMHSDKTTFIAEYGGYDGILRTKPLNQEVTRDVRHVRLRNKTTSVDGD